MDIACYMTAAFLCVASQLGTTEVSVHNAGFGASGVVQAENWRASASFFRDVIGPAPIRDRLTEACYAGECLYYHRVCEADNGTQRCTYRFDFSIADQMVVIEAGSAEAMDEAQTHLGILLRDVRFDAIPFAAMAVESEWRDWNDVLCTYDGEMTPEHPGCPDIRPFEGQPPRPGPLPKTPVE